MKDLLLSTAIVLTALGTTSTALAIEIPDAGRRDAPISEEYEGVWVGTLPAGCGGVTESTPAAKRKTTLKLCVDDYQSESNRRLNGLMLNKYNLELLQTDASTQKVGKNLRFIDSAPLNGDEDDPSTSLFTELRGSKKRTTNLAVVVADEKDAAVADPGDLVGTLGNCGLAVVWKWQKNYGLCGLPLKKRMKRENRKRKRKKRK